MCYGRDWYGWTFPTSGWEWRLPTKLRISPISPWRRFRRSCQRVKLDSALVRQTKRKKSCRCCRTYACSGATLGQANIAVEAAKQKDGPATRMAENRGGREMCRSAGSRELQKYQGSTFRRRFNKLNWMPRGDQPDFASPRPSKESQNPGRPDAEATAMR